MSQEVLTNDNLEKKISCLYADLYFYENKIIDMKPVELSNTRRQLEKHLVLYESQQGRAFNARGNVEEIAISDSTLVDLKWQFFGYVKETPLTRSMTVSICEIEKYLLIRSYESPILVRCLTDLAFQAEKHYFNSLLSSR